ncbi:MAG: flavin reductase family protein [Candidatus Hodarchaeota archaeon]
MYNDINQDIKKYRKAEKLKKWRDEVQPIPWYFDGLENLCDRIHPEKQLLQVTDIESLSHDTKLFRFISAEPKKALAPFRAGQYIGLTVEINGVRTSRPFSIVSSPNQLAYYELGIKRKEGGFVSPYLLDNLKIGDIIEATEPMGNFYYNPIFHGDNLVFIAGGSGITPFMSMLRNITERMFSLNVVLIFGCLTETDILFREDLEEIQNRRPNIKVEYVLSADPDWAGECGFITKDIISKYTGSIKEKYFYVVGNRDMYMFIQGELEAMGVPKHRILYEAYGVPEDITKIMGWPKEIDATKEIQITVDFISQGRKEQKVFEASCTEPLLNSLERTKELGYLINSGCRSGACAFCRTKLVSGNVFVPPEVTIREVDQIFGYLHPCISYPITDIHLDLTLT